MTPELAITGHTASLRFTDFGLDAYRRFLEAKALPEKHVTYDWEADAYTLTTHARFAARLGGAVPPAEREPLPLSDFLFDYQAYIVRRALEAQRFAVFADTGLGKSLIFLEWARQVRHVTQDRANGGGGKVLILTLTRDLREQTREMAAQFYPAMPLLPLDSREGLRAWLTVPQVGVAIACYSLLADRKDGLFPEFRFLAGLAADESSILKSGGGVVKWNLIKSARGIDYKLSLTATPAPNDVIEYASQASFLEKLRTGSDVIWTFFTHEDKASGKGWTVKPHARRAFYEWMSSWSFYIRSPRRFGFGDNLADDVPPPEFHEVAVEATTEQLAFAQETFARAGAGLFGDRALGVTHRLKLSQAAKGFVYTHKDGQMPIPSRKPGTVAGIVCDEVRAGRSVLVWTVFDEESRLIAEQLARRRIPGEHGPRPVVCDVLDGKMSDEARSEAIARFRNGQTDILISKASLLGYGLNFQQCSSMIFSGWDDSYERFYQAVRRAYRYGQTKTVRVWLPVVAELEGMILENVLQKKASFEQDAAAQEECFLEVFRDAR
ncbi:MAG: hypothetical protein JO250_09245 [Armatimonadetes bacterium]|nr:hypothetical protein [Armatimonadota bacterium]